ncbi:MAG: MlaD family protein, partial [Pseudomonadota bacterium]
METRASFILVGSFVLSFFIAIILAVVWLADVDVDADSTQYDIFFEGSVSGLAVGNSVRYNGIPIGVVTDLRISAARFGEVRVTVEVPSDVPIREDAVARLEYQGITGIGFIEIDGGTQDAAPLTRIGDAENPEIASEKSALQQVFDQAPQIAENLARAIEQVEKLLSDDSIESIGQALVNVETFSQTLAESSEDIGTLLREGATTMTQIRATADQAERLVAAFADRADEISLATEDTIFEAQALVQDVRAFTAQLDQIAKQVEPVVAEAGGAVNSYAGLAEDLRVDAERLTETLEGTLKQLDGVVVSVGGEVTTLTQRAGQTMDRADTMFSETQDSIASIARTTEDTLAAYQDLA